MVSSIGSVASSIFQQYQGISSDSASVSTKQSLSFEELVGNGVVENSEKASSDEISSMGGSSKSSDSSSAKSEMDLNQDGVITIDEVMQYVAMQMAEQMQEQMASDEASDQMSQESEQNTKQQQSDMKDFKIQMASQAYQMGEGLLNASIGAVTQSFAV